LGKGPEKLLWGGGKKRKNQKDFQFPPIPVEFEKGGVFFPFPFRPRKKKKKLEGPKKWGPPRKKKRRTEFPHSSAETAARKGEMDPFTLLKIKPAKMKKKKKGGLLIRVPPGERGRGPSLQPPPRGKKKGKKKKPKKKIKPKKKTTPKKEKKSLSPLQVLWGEKGGGKRLNPPKRLEKKRTPRVRDKPPPSSLQKKREITASRIKIPRGKLMDRKSTWSHLISEKEKNLNYLPPRGGGKKKGRKKAR